MPSEDTEQIRRRLHQSLAPYIDRLPAGAVAAQVNESLAAVPILVVTAPPGAGKSTLLPLTILQSRPDSRIIMLEPRRAAARQIAMRMAHMLGEQVGGTVGYRMRFESKVSATTRIEVVTEGVMERMLIDDPTLDGIGTVIFDEFHERSLTADVSLALTIEARNVIRPDLHIVIMSATIDAGAICAALKAPLIEAQGRMFDVEVVNGDDADMADCVPAVAAATKRAYREQDGNILVFLPGQGEIARCADLLADGALPGAEILPLYGLQTPAEQRRALEFDPDGGRKVILATPIAETSLTIDGVRVVIDSGLCRAVKFNPSTGLSTLVTARITMDMARQRSGRAGRLCNGVCYRLFSKATEQRMPDSRTPEILEADLSGMVLDIAAWGGDAAKLPWLTPPPPGHIAQAQRLLSMLKAIDSDGRITPHGRRMAALPCHPRISNMLATAPDAARRALAADIAAIIEEKDPLNDDNDADINTRIELLRQQRRRGCGGPWKRIARVAEQYRRMVRCQEDNNPVNQNDTGMLLALAYPERVAMQYGDGVFRLPGGDNVRINEADDLSACQFLAVAAMDRRIFLASPVDKEALMEIAEPYQNVSWNSREKCIVARDELRLGVLVIDSKPIAAPDRDLIMTEICRAAVREGRSIFDFSDEVERLQRRIATVAAWHPEFGLPDVSADTLLASAAEWLPMYTGRATTAAELRKIDLCAVISGIIGYEMQAEVDRLAPTHLRLPGGRNARIDYRPGSGMPVVSARLQDCFGLLDTPRLDDGRRPVLMELLSPGFKPVQITQDLHGFWTSTYFEVRKELRRRYPKHRWPDDPLSV